MIAALTTACFVAAAQAYAIPQETFYVVAMRLEGGWEGLAKPNRRKDGTIRSEDLGRYQVNTAWVHAFTGYWQKNGWLDVRATDRDTYLLLRDDGCANAYAASAILRYYWQMTGNLQRAVAYYHTGPKGSAEEMSRYLGRYRSAMAAFGYRPQ